MSKLLEQILKNNPNAFKKSKKEVLKHIKNESKRYDDLILETHAKSQNPKDGEFFSPEPKSHQLRRKELESKGTKK
jgi:hypothetical protein